MKLDKKKYHLKILDSKSQNYLVTIIIGKKVKNTWQKFIKNNWIKYCKNNKLGLIVITKDLVDKKNIYWKKATWQKMLIGKYLKDNFSKKIANICYLDSDIIINPFAPNIFDFHQIKKISIVSMVKNLPYNLLDTRKKISYYRNKFYSKKYPLDSSIFMNYRKIYKYHNLMPQKDFFCAGLFIFNLNNFAEDMANWFFKYKKNIQSITGGGDQVHLNYEVFKKNKVNILDYKFQALWIYEIVNKYPFLYDKNIASKKIIKECIEKSILDNFFLHFAGSWYESEMWKIKGILPERKIKFYSIYLKYLKKIPSGRSRGRITPQMNKINIDTNNKL